MSAGKKLTMSFYAVCAVIAVFLCWLYQAAPGTGRLSLSAAKLLNTDERQEGDVQTRTAVLPQEFDGGQCLLFKSTHSRVEVFVNDEEVYSFGTEKPILGKSPGTYWHVVEIPGNSGGQTLTVRQTTVYNAFYGSSTDISYGSRGDCTLELVRMILPVLLLNLIIIFAGLISLLLHVRTLRRQEKNETGSFLCIGLFALTIAAWSLRQCGFLQFVIPSGRVLYFLDMLVFFLFPVPLNLFIYTVCRSKYKRGFLCLAAAYLIGMAAETAIQFAGILDIFEMLRSIHLLMALNALYVFWAVHQEARLEKESLASRLRVPLYILMAFGIMELVSYYVRLFDDISIFLPTGTLVFIVMLIWQQIQQYYQGIMEEQKVYYYEKLATTDVLTGALNRNAYEQALEELLKDRQKLDGQCVILFDMNNMKIINDNFGHDKGDEALKSCFGCIKSVFGGKGKCYRIGGDEFIFLSRDESGLREAAARFDDVIGHVAQRMEFPFSVAFGYAIYNPEKDEDIRATIRRSDALMYEDKRRKKAGKKGIAAG